MLYSSIRTFTITRIEIEPIHMSTSTAEQEAVLQQINGQVLHTIHQLHYGKQESGMRQLNQLQEAV